MPVRKTEKRYDVTTFKYKKEAVTAPKEQVCKNIMLPGTVIWVKEASKMSDGTERIVLVIDYVK